MKNSVLLMSLGPGVELPYEKSGGFVLLSLMIWCFFHSYSLLIASE